MSQLTYLKAGVTPGFQHIEIIELETGVRLHDVFEVNTVQGWLEQAVRDQHGRLVVEPGSEQVKRLRITGRFELRRLPR